MNFLICKFCFVVFWRKTSIWIWSNTNVQIRPCWLFSTWFPFPLLLSFLWGTPFKIYSLCFVLKMFLYLEDELQFVWVVEKSSNLITSRWSWNPLCCVFQGLFPFQDWWVVPVKVAFDQTAWSAVWNSIYFVVLGLLRLESPVSIFNELKATFWPMLTVSDSIFFPNLHIFLS